MCSDRCGWLHKELSRFPEIKYPFDLKSLPLTGIYFFYEKGEFGKGHGNIPRIVRIGIANIGNFRLRISEHFLLNEEFMNFDANKRKPSDRSIFRKNIGRAILNKDQYLALWNVDFTKIENRKHLGHLRNIQREQEVEKQITIIIRNNFSFRFLIIEKELHEWEAKITATINKCTYCGPSNNWFGKNIPEPKIRNSGLWQVQHLQGDVLDNEDQFVLNQIFRDTEEFNKKYTLESKR